jgi:adenylosuccinate lyase
MLTSISPLDGRYSQKVEELRAFFSESALMRYRVLVEIEWFIFLCHELKLEGTKVFKAAEIERLRGLWQKFDPADANRIKEIEKTTNHDVKAVEYFLKEKLKESVFEPYFEFIHFACTSEDINNLAYALMLRDAMQRVIFPVLIGLKELIFEKARKYQAIPMISRTHGQPATPTTLGKEFINFLARLERQLEFYPKIFGKINGAIGNFNAHIVAYPKIDWLNASVRFIATLGLKPSLYTTQIEPHDFLAEIFDKFKLINTILIDFNRDIWTYISFGYFKQKLKEGEVGSSTMPHKVNPIDFENSEGNLGLANALFEYFSAKLPISRLQRDLTDSTTLRNIGSAFAYSLLAYKSCIQGLHKLELNEQKLKMDLDEAWELLAEPVQVVMRKYKLEKPYEQLKKLTRGKKITQKTLHTFIDGLKIPAPEKKRLKNLTPSKYIGLAKELVENYESYRENNVDDIPF